MGKASTIPDLRRFPCSNCGAKLEFAPGTTSLVCPFCQTQNTISGADKPVEERDFRAAVAELAHAAAKVEHFSVKCDACGAEINKPPSVTSMTCPFCASNIVMTAMAATHIKPWGVLPFLVTKEQATQKFRDWLRSRWFAPSALKRDGQIDQRLSGVYVPAWTFDAGTTSAYTGERGDAYYVTVRTGKTTTTQRRIRWTPASGVVAHDFDDVLVLASRSLPTDKAESLEPWDTARVVPYADDYLAGFKAECYQIDLPEGFGIAQGIIAEAINQLIRADIGGDEQRIHSVDTDYHGITFKHLLLPVWISAYRYAEKVYRFLVNARTGEVQGERPYSWVKITLAVLCGLLLIGIITLIASQK